MRVKTKTKTKIVTIYCKDGPLQGGTYSVKVEKRKAFIALPANPFYQSACYLVTETTTPLNEKIAVFSHCRKREPDEQT